MECNFKFRSLSVNYRSSPKVVLLPEHFINIPFDFYPVRWRREHNANAYFTVGDGGHEVTESKYARHALCMNIEVMRWACAISASFMFESSSQGACLLRITALLSTNVSSIVSWCYFDGCDRPTRKILVIRTVPYLFLWYYFIDFCNKNTSKCYSYIYFGLLRTRANTTCTSVPTTNEKTEHKSAQNKTQASPWSSPVYSHAMPFKHYCTTWACNAQNAVDPIKHRIFF